MLDIKNQDFSDEKRNPDTDQEIIVNDSKIAFIKDGHGVVLSKEFVLKFINSQE